MAFRPFEGHVVRKNCHILKFEELGLAPGLIEGLAAMRFEEATPIQQQAIPVLLENRDMIASAQTGTGKTAAYLLPVLHKLALKKKRDYSINTLILAPTRELAMQIDQQLMGFGYFVEVSSIAVYGGGTGAAWERERKALTEGAEVIIATPGKLLSFMRQRIGDFSKLEHFILDEADRMLDMGFIKDILEIASYLPEKRQNLLFSATFPPKIREFAKKILHEPTEINITDNKPAEGVVQAAFLTYNNQKVELVKYLLRDDDMPNVIIFASTKKSVKELTQALKAQDLKVCEIHSDLEQAKREETLQDFKAQKVNVLVATDIISRGIDIDSVSMVINYDVPGDPEDYVHRVGRTARAQQTGEAVTFINERDQRQFLAIEEFIEREVRKVDLPKHLGEGPAYEPNKRSRGHFPKKRTGPAGGGSRTKSPRKGRKSSK